MEFNKLAKSQHNTQGNQLSNSKEGKGGLKLDPKSMGSQALLPQAKTMLTGLFSSYGLQFPEINMGDPKLKDKVVAIGKVAEIAKVNVTALKQLLRHTKSLMDGQVALAQFYASATDIVVDGKKKIDRATVEAFLSLMDYNKHSQALASKVERRLKALDAKYELVGQLGEGKLQTSLKLIESQKQAGEKRQENTRQLQAEREKLLTSAQIKRQKEREFIRVGHLTESDK